MGNLFSFYGETVGSGALVSERRNGGFHFRHQLFAHVAILDGETGFARNDVEHARLDRDVATVENAVAVAFADEVMRGEHGNGQDRVNSLGSSYDAVQAEVNRRLYGGANNSSNISALADAVMRGEYGNGADRVNALGSNYAAVQDEVNRRLYG